VNNADLAEIRALLQASAPPERRPRGPLLGAIRSLLPTAAAEARPAMPPPRRVGLRTADAADIEAVEELMLSDPLDADGSEARRRAFGQRHGTTAEFAPILRLAAPLSPEPAMDDAPLDAEVSEILRRRSLRLARLAAPAGEAHAHEPPYHPEDMADGGDAERIYAESGLFEPHPAAAPPLSQAEDSDPQRQLLRHLERVFVAEQAALNARMAEP
jgi:hypothetical protein